MEKDLKRYIYIYIHVSQLYFNYKKNLYTFYLYTFLYVNDLMLNSYIIYAYEFSAKINTKFINIQVSSIL